MGIFEAGGVNTLMSNISLHSSRIIYLTSSIHRDLTFVIVISKQNMAKLQMSNDSQEHSS